MSTITVDEAENIVYGNNLAIQDVSEHRWYDKLLVVYEEDGELKGFYHLRPKTEEQEGMEEFESDPVEVFPVKAREITVTIYEPKGE